MTDDRKIDNAFGIYDPKVKKLVAVYFSEERATKQAVITNDKVVPVKVVYMDPMKPKPKREPPPPETQVRKCKIVYKDEPVEPPKQSLPTPTSEENGSKDTLEQFL